MAYFKNTNKTPTIEYVKDFKTPIIFFNTEVLLKIKAYVDECDKEISWLGVVEKIEADNKKENDHDCFLITDVMLVPQEVSSSTVELTQEGLSEFGTKLIQSNQSELFNKIKMWGHSHVNMSVSASSTDDETFEDFYKNSDFFIRSICNKKGEMKVDFIDCNSGIKYMDITWYENKSAEQIQLEKMINDFNEKQDKLFEDIKEKVKLEMKKNLKEEPKVISKYNYIYDDDYDDYTFLSNDFKKKIS